jgi:arylsulfatase A-like enzyme
VLLIISDDQAYGDFGFMGHPHIQTPNIDRLADQSLTFTRGYVAAPLCSPSLASIASGLYPYQHKITGNDPSFEFEEDRYSSEWLVERQPHFDSLLTQFYSRTTPLPERLEARGYTSLQTGKWWLGPPERAGFDRGMTHADPERGGRHGDEGLTIGREGLEPAYQFMDSAIRDDDPFFLWYAPYLPHFPHNPPDSLLQKYTDRAPTEAVARYWAMCDWFDQTVGELLAYLQDEGIEENTLVVFIVDNGWVQDPTNPGRYEEGSKRAPYEDGIRTPIMVRWPGHVEPRRDSTTFVSAIDLVPTILQAADIQPADDLPGLNLMDSSALAEREYLFAEDYAHDIPSVEDPTQGLQHSVVLRAPWKLIVPDSTNRPEADPELFHLFEDPEETQNRIEDHPEVRNELQNRLRNWRTE